MINKKKIVGKGKYLVGEHLQFVNRNNKLVRITRDSPEPVPMGEAYAYFNCDAPKQQLK